VKKFYVKRYSDKVEFEITKGGGIRMYIVIPDPLRTHKNDLCNIVGCDNPKFVTQRRKYRLCYNHQREYWQIKSRESRLRRKNARQKPVG